MSLIDSLKLPGPSAGEAAFSCARNAISASISMSIET